MSPEAKAASSERMKKRWAEKREGNGAAPPEAAKPPRQIAKRTDVVLSNVPPPIDDIEYIDWETVDIEKAKFLIGKFRESYERSAQIIQRRIYDKAQVEMICYVCGKHIERIVYRDDACINERTNLKETALICSPYCYAQYGVKRQEMRTKLKEYAAGRKV